MRPSDGFRVRLREAIKRYELREGRDLTQQELAGLDRHAWEVEAGYRFTLPANRFVQYVQPAGRVSDLKNDFDGSALLYPAPSIWWDWRKVDVGLRIGFARNIDLTIERSLHEVEAPRDLDLDETLATIQHELDLQDDDIYLLDGPLDLGGLWSVHALDRPDARGAGSIH